MKKHLPPIMLFLSLCCLFTAACNPYGHTPPQADLRPMDSVVIEGTPEEPDTIHYASTRATLGLPVVWYGVQLTDSGWVVSGTRWPDDTVGEPLEYISRQCFEYQDGVLTLTETGGLDFGLADTVKSIELVGMDSYRLELRSWGSTPRTFNLLIENEDVARGIWTWRQHGETSYYVQDRSVENYPLVCSVVWEGYPRL